MGFQAVCIGYMLCKKYGIDTQNFAIDRIPDELKNKILTAISTIMLFVPWTILPLRTFDWALESPVAEIMV